ncbi:MAG: DUF1634 domain-containing protein [Armatimonadota bacterium]|nr:DUF1634 domain-containing protein [Armatimonadota bacterium]
MSVPRTRSLEDIIGRMLMAGVLTSAVIIATGLALLVPPGTGKRLLLSQLMSEHEVFVADLPRSLVAVVTGALHGRPVAIVFLGLLLLIFTPVLRVIAAGAYFARHGERRYALVSAVVLLLLLLGFVLGAAT